MNINDLKSNNKFNGMKIKAALKRGDLDDILKPFQNTTFTTIQMLNFIEANINGPFCIECHNEVTKWNVNLLCRICRIKHQRQKTLDTFIKNYGTDNPFNTEKIIEKRKKTNRDKHGFDYPMQSKEVRQKSINTNLEKYGVKNPQQNKEIRERTKKTILGKYGVENISHHPETTEKRKQRSLERFGVGHPSNIPEIRQKISKKHRENRRDYFPNNFDEMFDKYAREYTSGKHTIKWLSHKLGIKFDQTRNILKENNIPLNDISNTSYEEKEFYTEIFNKFEYNVEFNVKRLIDESNKEIDIWFPDQRIGIEYHGVYWHSFKKDIHFDKAKKCYDKNISLIQVMSTEWDTKPEIIKSIILSKFSQFETKIYARLTTIKEISNEDYKIFTNVNHLQGYSQSKIKLGLFYNDELVSVMSFSKPRYNNKYEWEMIRYCNKLNTQVVGGASKLFKYFVNTYNPSSIITYADSRYSFGKIYETLNFTFSHWSKPNYFYYKGNSPLEGRHKYQKHKLKGLFPEKYDENKTEQEIMIDNGYKIIYDAGNLVFTWNK